jgi:Protein of unknown function (DUF2917)
MNIDGAHLSLRLPEHAYLSLRNALGVCVRAQRGYLWITQAGDSVDHLIEPGAEFVLDRNGKTIISAITDAEFELENRRRVRHPMVSRLLALVGMR